MRPFAACTFEKERRNHLRYINPATGRAQGGFALEGGQRDDMADVRETPSIRQAGSLALIDWLVRVGGKTEWPNLYATVW